MEDGKYDDLIGHRVEVDRLREAPYQHAAYLPLNARVRQRSLEDAADALSTSVFVMGVEQGLRLIGTLPDYDSIVIDAEGRLFYSAGLEPPGAQDDD